MQQRSTTTFKDSSGSDILDMQEAGEWNHRAERLAGKATITERSVVVLLYVHRNCRFIRDGSPGRPPRLSHSSWALKNVLLIGRIYISLQELEERTAWGYYTKDIVPSISYRTKAKGLKRSMTLIERTRKGHRHSGQHCNCFKSSTGNTKDGLECIIMRFPKCVDTILNSKSQMGGKSIENESTVE